jgi:hypothetical protein
MTSLLKMAKQVDLLIPSSSFVRISPLLFAKRKKFK